MKRWQQWLSVYLVSCLAFAGAVGLSPELHVAVEHGGHSHVHAHPHTHTHPHQGTYSHPAAQPARTASERGEWSRRLTEQCPPPTLFGITPADIYRAIGQCLAAVFDLGAAPDPVNESDEHEHHTLAQLLLSGAVEGLTGAMPIAEPAEAQESVAPDFASSFFPSVFDAQSASRAPPVLNA